LEDKFHGLEINHVAQ
jgi:transposase InsO family protein